MIDLPMTGPPPLPTADPRRGGRAAHRPGGGRWPAGYGLLVVGHGTADPLGAAEAAAVAALVADRLPGVPVEIGFLEVIEPGIGAAVARLAARGCRTVVAAPLLLQTAGHARQDVPEALAAAAAEARVGVVQAGSLGCHPALVAVSRHRRRAAVLKRDRVAAAVTALVMVGRGASDPTTAAQLEAFTALSLAGDPGAPAHVTQGFVAVTRPHLADALAGAAGLPGIRRVVVQPHLLFRGHVEREVTAAIARARGAAPRIDWVTTARLGGGAAVSVALVERAFEAVAGTVVRP
jgi:sirohydrochlorin cobaltochelatase